ncbi:MAG: hypothetical protein E7200_00505 [Selenomonas ruminantium]|nr:hypothetical protein [Selenomonas ruminantium]
MPNKPVYNIMLAFVSLVQQRSVDNPIRYWGVGGKPYTAIQTNESAIIAVQRELGDNPLDAVFLVSSEKVETYDAPKTEQYGILTHINFLKKRLIEADERLSGKLHSIRYYDGLDDIDESLRNVTKIAGQIMDYAREHPKARIRLYADMTGGFRYNSVMMLTIMQLLQYNGIELGKVLYSDPERQTVFDATSLLGLFNLINGADEFVKFGSVEGLQAYFKTAPKTEALGNLLEAMQRFSDAIKMCRTSLIKDELKTLNVYLKAFKENHGDTLQENLFASIITTLQHEYGPLIQGQATEFDIIRWCTRKGFLQQAMTLCTEWLPSYLVNKKIAYTDNPRVLLYCEREGRKQGRSWQQYFISTYVDNGSRYSKNDADNLTLAEFIKADILAFNSGNKKIGDLKSSKYSQIVSFCDDRKKAEDDFIFLRSRMLSFEDFEKKYAMLGKVLRTLHKESQSHAKRKKSLQDFCYDISLENIANRIAELQEQEIYNLFAIPNEDYGEGAMAEEVRNEFLNIQDDKWNKHADRYRSLYDKGYLRSSYRYNDMLECLKEYFHIRVERNQINHANTEDITSVGEVRAMILNPLEHWVSLVAGKSK